MATLERALSVADAFTTTRCVVCGALAEGNIELEPVAGVPLDEDASKLVGRLARSCRACEQEQLDAKRYAARAVYGAIFAVPAIALAGGVVARRPDGLAAAAAALAAFVGAVGFVRIVLRRRARRAPLLLIGADDDSMLVQVNAPAPSPARSGYREPASPTAARGSTVKPLPPRSSYALAWAAALMASLGVCGLASAGALAPTRVLVVDSPSAAVKVTIDDVQTIDLAAGGRSVSRIRSGTHRYRVQYLPTDRIIMGTFDVAVFEDTLLTTDATQCYMVWVAQGSRATEHGEGPVRWTSVGDARSSERCH